MLSKSLRTLLGAITVLGVWITPLTYADDTDIYLSPSVPESSKPLVMFVLDWRPNLTSTVACPVGSYCAQMRTAGYLVDGKTAASGSATTFFDILRAVLKKVIDPLGGVRIGFMLNHAHKNGCAGNPPAAKCSNGAYVPRGFKSMSAGSDDPDTWQTSGEDSDKVDFANFLTAIPVPAGAASHPFQGKELYFELFRYLTGQKVYNGHQGIVDFGDSPTDNVNLDIDRPTMKWDTSIETGSSSTAAYVSPLHSSNQCAKIYVINLMFQVSQQEDDSDAAIKATKPFGGMAGINLAGPANNFATVIEYMNDVDLADGSFGSAPNLNGMQNVVSYFVVDPTKINVTTNGYAAAGGTGTALALSSDPQLLVNTLNDIFKSILSVSTTFVAPSVPVNVFNRAQIVNEVFMALFEADKDGFPFWPGNLKKVKIGENATTHVPELHDVNGINAIDIDGRLRHDAVTFWTNTGALPTPVGDEVAGADGRGIKRGGAGQKIPGFGSSPGLTNAIGPRQLFTEDPTDVTDGLMPLNGDVATATVLWASLKGTSTAATYPVATTTEQNRAVMNLKYARGFAAATITDTSLRNWYLGDPLHSRPRPVNYGARGSYSTANPDIRVLMATTDGALHMFRNTATGGAQDGSETWAYVPRGALAGLDRLRTSTTGTPIHPLSFDGSPAVLQIDNDFDGTIEPGDGDKVWAFVGLRRGGKALYAIDITDPDAPKFKWTVNKSTTGFSELGQTWSTPQVGMIDIGSGVQPVVVFGGGYNGDDGGDNVGDLGKDAANRSNTYGADDDEGNAVYIVDAASGVLIWKATDGTTAGYVSASKKYIQPAFDDSVPAELTAIDSNGDGKLDRLYFGDTGGRVWRADIAGAVRADWSLTMLLNAGRHFSSAANNDLRFFTRPDVAPTRDGSGNFDAVIIGSGDREDPLETTTQNWFFMIKDRHTSSGAPPTTTLTPTNLANLSVDCVGAGTCDTTTRNNLTNNGWRMALGAAGSGELTASAATTVGGQVFFTTFQPSAASDTCGLSEGSGFQYAVSLQTAEAVYNYDLANDTDGAVKKDRRDSLGSGGIPVEVVPIGDNYVLIQGQETGQNIQSINAATNWRTYWYEVPK
jgi:type IV pilus assembly protein PilY1